MIAGGFKLPAASAKVSHPKGRREEQRNAALHATHRRQPSDCLRKTQAQAVCYSFPVKAFHPLQYSRRSLSAFPPTGRRPPAFMQMR